MQITEYVEIQITEKKFDQLERNLFRNQYITSALSIFSVLRAEVGEYTYFENVNCGFVLVYFLQDF